MALSINLIVTMELFSLNRSVQILSSRSIQDRENKHFTKAARLRTWTDKVFTLLKRKVWEAIAKLKKGVTPAKAGVQKFF